MCNMLIPIPFNNVCGGSREFYSTNLIKYIKIKRNNIYASSIL